MNLLHLGGDKPDTRVLAPSVLLCRTDGPVAKECNRKKCLDGHEQLPSTNTKDGKPLGRPSVSPLHPAAEEAAETCEDPIGLAADSKDAAGVTRRADSRVEPQQHTGTAPRAGSAARVKMCVNGVDCYSRGHGGAAVLRVYHAFCLSSCDLQTSRLIRFGRGGIEG